MQHPESDNADARSLPDGMSDKCLCVHMLLLYLQASDSRRSSCHGKSEHRCTRSDQPRHEPVIVGREISLETRQQVKHSA